MSKYEFLVKPDIDLIIGKAIDVFSSFYGEKYKTTIKNRLKNSTIIVYNNPSNINKYIDEYGLYVSKFDEKTINENSSILEKINYFGLSEYNDRIVNKIIPFSNYVILNNIVGVMPYLENDNLKTVLYFPTFGTKYYNLDCTMIHELLHIIEEHIIVFEDNFIVSQGGFEKTILKGNYDGNREYEYVNEIIHQRIAEEVTNYMHNQNIYLFNDEVEAKVSMKYYEENRNIVEETFYQKYSNLIAKVKLEGNTDWFISMIGETNMKNYIKWIKKYYDQYPTIESRLNKEDLSYKEIMNEGLLIVEKMKSIIN